MPLAALLTKDLARRKKRGSPSDEPALYGAPLPTELAALLAANETHPLDRQTWGELRPLFFEEPFALPGRDAAK